MFEIVQEILCWEKAKMGYHFAQWKEDCHQARQSPAHSNKDKT
jgi:hypothetical protein